MKAEDEMKRKYRIGDTVEIVNNESGGFRNGKIVKVSSFRKSAGDWQNLVLWDGNNYALHVCDEVKLVEE